jgi:hypothetical protein
METNCNYFKHYSGVLYGVGMKIGVWAVKAGNLELVPVRKNDSQTGEDFDEEIVPKNLGEKTDID